ncbi:hypothetical protein JK358_24000 [Nocardia sp. 2]|uniref:Uncharacterized protein n=1 Tax=Nocardia acididurans TaxID=2802282 RepID=A0ABS1MA24_9NOCA|nr:hypothetical protein [Nocardia acididurans]MBL1077472.1 hypothetical protein [Nocardia acididurans]
MDENLTLEQAQSRSLQYMTETLSELPAGAYLSSVHPQSPDGRGFSRGSIVGCDDKASKTGGPVNFGLNYWVLGLPSGSGDRHVDTVVQSWEDKGMRVVKRRGEPGSDYDVYVDSTDGYRLVAGRNTGNDVYLTVSSPCFPRPAPKTDVDTMPSVVNHP